jgi:hypothetical protein
VYNDRCATDVLGYCDWAFRGGVGFSEDTSICDIELQHDYSLTSRQSLTWGGAVPPGPREKAERRRLQPNSCP